MNGIQLNVQKSSQKCFTWNIWLVAKAVQLVVRPVLCMSNVMLLLAGESERAVAYCARRPPAASWRIHIMWEMWKKRNEKIVNVVCCMCAVSNYTSIQFSIANPLCETFLTRVCVRCACLCVHLERHTFFGQNIIWIYHYSDIALQRYGSANVTAINKWHPL